MSLFRFSNRILKSNFSHFRCFWLNREYPFPIPYNQVHSFVGSPNKVVADHVVLLQQSTINKSVFQRFGFSSSASPEPFEKENAESASEVTNQKDDSGSSSEPQSKMSQSPKTRRRGGTKRIAFSDSDSEIEELSMEDLVKLVKKKEELLKMKQKEIVNMQDKVLRTYADMENVMDRTKREAENSKKFALQNFAKGLLDVADNLNRASSVVKESFSKIDTSRDASGAVPLLKTLLEGVEMTEKQLSEVFRKFGVEKYDPINEQFDPNRHNAVFQVPNSYKPPGTVAAVLKAGYTLHDRVLRPAEVGVTEGGSKA